MMRFMWDPKYSVDIKSIDTQHQKFFEIINQIYFLTSEKEFDKGQLLTIIDELVEYGDFHMTYEEKYFKEFKYPGTLKHIAAHNEFRKQVKQYLKLTKKPDTKLKKLGNEIADFTKNWLSQHILDMDHQYSQLFLIHDLR